MLRLQPVLKPLALALLTATTFQPLHAQETAAPTVAAPSKLQDLLAGRNLPLAIQAKNLDSSYRRLVVEGQPDIMSMKMRMMGVMAGVELGLYFTKGNTITVGSETYLVAYRPQTRIDPEVFQHRGHGNAEPVQPQRLRPNDRLALSLLNLRATTSLNDIRIFDPKQDLETPQQMTAASTRQLQQLGRGVLTWLNARGRGVLPVVGGPVTPALQRQFYPFVHDQRLWTNPVNQQPYRANPALSRRRVRDVTNARFLPLFYEATPGADDKRGVLFLDGHVERVTAERWQRLQKAEVKMRSPKSTAKSATRPTPFADVDGDEIVEVEPIPVLAP
jgi:prepilin-type processing-associated H-X9-DG protein